MSIANEIRDKQDMMDANIASIKLNELTVLHARLTSIIAERQHAYLVKLDETMTDNDLSVSKAEVKAKASKEYGEYLEAINLEKSTIEIIRALKLFIRIRQKEEEISGNLQ
jgi:Holliday junction resolvase-like predicted endonuclease